jgi:hypothetical protein
MANTLDLKLENKLPVSLKNEFWIQLMKTVEEEINLIRDETERKKFIYSIRESQLVDLEDFASVAFGMPFRIFENLKNSLKEYYGFTDEEIASLLRKELSKVAFNIVNKSSFLQYKSFFNVSTYAFPYEISIYFTVSGLLDPVTGEPIIARDIQDFSTVTEADAYIDDENTFINDNFGIFGFYEEGTILIQESVGNFKGIKIPLNPPSLDHPDAYLLDDPTAEVNALDFREEDVPQGTRHIAFEIVIRDSIVKKDSVVLFPFSIMQYIKENIIFYRKATEVPHIGAQFSVFSNASGYWNYSPEQIISDNLVKNPDFLEDALWIKEEGWKIQNGFLERSYYPSVETKAEYPLNEIYLGAILRITLDIESMTGPCHILDGDLVVKDSFQILGEYTITLDWTSAEKNFYLSSIDEIKIKNISVLLVENYTKADTRLKIASNLTYIEEGLSSITALEFGYGSLALPKFNDVTYDFPEELENSLARIEPISGIEEYSGTEQLGAIAEYTGQFINNIDLDVLFDGIEQDFEGVLPSYVTSIKPKTVVFALKNLTLEEPFIDFLQDNGVGDLIGQNNFMKGSINYTTGAYSLTSKFNAMVEENFIDMSTASSTYSNSLNKIMIENSGVFFFKYQAEEETEPTEYFIGETDGILHSNFSLFNSSLSSLTEGSEQTSFEFKFNANVLLTDLRYVYQYSVDLTYNSDYALEVFRLYTNKSYSITEVGVFGTTEANSDEKLLAYMTFAPIELYTNNFHLNMGVILKK